MKSNPDDIFRRVPAVPGLEVTRDGKFRLNGRPRKAIFGKKRYGNGLATVRFHWMQNGVSHYIQASKCVAMAWKSEYRDGDCIIYRDGDCHNIHADNLEVVGKKRYSEYLRRNSMHRADGVEERKRKLGNVIKEAGLTLHYFETLDIEPINRHVTEYLYPCLMEYCRSALFLGESTSLSVVPDCLARMYECIMNGMCLYNYERYCKRLLLNYKKKGDFGFTGSVPKPIQIIVQHLNLDCLWEKYKVTDTKKKFSAQGR